MKVLIHALGATMGGALRHLTSFIPELGKANIGNEYVFLVRESFPKIENSENVRIDRIPDGYAERWIHRGFHDVVLLPRKLRSEKFSIVVSLTNFGPIWTPIPHVSFQRNALFFCNYYLSKLHGRWKAEVLLQRRLIIESMKRAELIVTPSDSMGEMIKDSCPELKNKRYRTLYHGFERDMFQEPLSEKIKKMIETDRVKLFYPTHPAPHKGFEVLFDILACLKEKGLEYILFSTIEVEDWPEVVRPYEERVHELDLCGNVVFMGRIPQGQMGALYETCDLMVYPSLCESFGFSMIEAMGHGLPIVAAATAVNREICGDGANYYDPLSAEDGTKAILTALEPEVHARLKGGGRKRINSFDWGWSRYAKEFSGMINTI